MKKILVVGKDPKVSEHLRKYFDPQEYKLLSSYDAKNAIASAVNLKPDLIILNLNLHDHSGLDVLKKLKESNSNLPIIAVIDSLSNLGDIEILKKRVFGFMKRPIQPEKLSYMVKEALSININRKVHTTPSGEREQRELKEITNFPGVSQNPEKVKINCEKSHQGYPSGNKNYDQIFEQLLVPIYDKIMVNSKGNIYDHLISGLEKSLISLTLKYCNHNQVRASQILGISRNTLRERIKRYDLW